MKVSVDDFLEAACCQELEVCPQLRPSFFWRLQIGNRLRGFNLVDPLPHPDDLHTGILHTWNSVARSWIIWNQARLRTQAFPLHFSRKLSLHQNFMDVRVCPGHVHSSSIRSSVLYLACAVWAQIRQNICSELVTEQPFLWNFQNVWEMRNFSALERNICLQSIRMFVVRLLTFLLNREFCTPCASKELTASCNLCIWGSQLRQWVVKECRTCRNCSHQIWLYCTGSDNVCPFNWRLTQLMSHIFNFVSPRNLLTLDIILNYY